MLKPDHTSSIADNVAPAKTDARFDADSRAHVGRDDVIAVGGILLFEPFAARHRHDTGRDAFCGECCTRIDSELDFRSGAYQHDIGGAIGVQSVSYTHLRAHE